MTNQRPLFDPGVALGNMKPAETLILKAVEQSEGGLTAQQAGRIKPDTDKLLRAIGDAITGIIVRDDSQLVIMIGQKFYGTPLTVREGDIARGIETALGAA